MTTTERLIRNISEQRRGEVIVLKNKAMGAIEQEVPWKDVPAKVQRAIVEHAKLSERLKSLTALVDAAGYDMPRESCSCDGETTPKMVSRDYSLRQREVSTVTAAYEARFSRIAQLKHDATVATLGRTVVEAKPILEQLQRDLVKA